MAPFLDETMYERTLKIMEGQYIEIGCPVSGTPTPKIVWFRNARQLFAENDDDNSRHGVHLGSNSDTVIFL